MQWTSGFNFDGKDGQYRLHIRLQLVFVLIGGNDDVLRLRFARFNTSSAWRPRIKWMCCSFKGLVGNVSSMRTTGRPGWFFDNFKIISLVLSFQPMTIV